MTYHPPRWLEALAGTLIPPASAEHALGDLAECSQSTRRYLANLASILPRIVWCQIRRRAHIGGIVFHAILTAIALLVALQASAGGRVAVPWAIWVVGCALAAAYGPRDKPAQWSSRLFGATILLALGSAWALGVPTMRVAIGLGSTVAVILVLSMPWLASQTPPPLTIDTLPLHARKFQQLIWWRNARESAAALVVLTMNARDLWRLDGLLARTGPALLVAGVLFIMYYLHFRAGSRRVPDADATTVLRFHRHEIERQRDILRAVPVWYLLPFVPGLLAMMVIKWPANGWGTLLGVPVLVALFALVWWLNVWAARWLDTQLQVVEALEGHTSP